MPLLLAGVAALAALLLYWPTLDLPLLYDDLLHIRITGGLDFGSVWLPTEAFGFYRPLTFLPLLIIERLFAGYPAGLLHGLNVCQHALNAALLVLLVWRMRRSVWWAISAGLLFAFFPFSYQAVTVYGHNVHPTTTGILLLGLHTYLSAHTGRKFWWLPTALLFGLGLLSHESAILFGPFAFLVQWTHDEKCPIQRHRPVTAYLRAPWFLFSLGGLLYLIGYQFLPLSRAPQADTGGGVWSAKGLYIFQTLAYPLMWVARYLPPAAGNWIIIGGIAIVAGLSAWSARVASRRPGLVLGLGWWGLASLLIALPLSATYLLHGPRLLYLGSVGLALLWPLLLVPFKRFSSLVPALLLVLILVQNGLFVRQKLQEYATLTGPVDMVQEMLAESPAGEGVLLVNLPQWLAPARNTYPAGVEIVSMLGDYLFVEELLAYNLGVDRPVKAIRLPENLADPDDYRFGIHEQAEPAELQSDWAPAGQHVFLVQYAPNGPQTTYTGQLRPGAPTATPLASFESYTLLAANAEQCANSTQVSLTWTGNDRHITPTTSVFVQLLAADGTLLAQADGPPLGLRPDLFPLSGRIITEQRTLPAAGTTVLVGVYDFVTGERETGREASGAPLSDNAQSVPITPGTDC
jgi:hypothetical protein